MTKTDTQTTDTEALEAYRAAITEAQPGDQVVLITHVTDPAKRNTVRMRRLRGGVGEDIGQFPRPTLQVEETATAGAESVAKGDAAGNNTEAKGQEQDDGSGYPGSAQPRRGAGFGRYQR